MLVNIAYMIVVPSASQADGNVAKQFIVLTLGRNSEFGAAHAAQILNAFMAFSSLGNVIVSTYTAARVKQEIAKEGILPFSKLIARNYDALSRLTSCFRRRPSLQHGGKSFENAGEHVSHEKTPLGALLVHWFFSLLIIFCTWKVKNPVTAYDIVFGIYSYTIDAFMAVTIGVGLLILRFWSSKTHWHLKSPSNAIISILSASIFVIANLFPVITLWVPPTPAFKNVNPYSWWLVPTIGVVLMVGSFFYWVVLVTVVPKIGGHRGKELRVERTPFFHTEHGEPVQVAEIVAFDWVVKESDFN
jgi:amino acid transporter